MKQIARITLQNEMDLVLAHRRSMKLAELAGLSLSAQTTFATAVAEVARNIIEDGENGSLLLGVRVTAQQAQYLVATILDSRPDLSLQKQGIYYARKLVNLFNLTTSGEGTSIEMQLLIVNPVKEIERKVDEWRASFESNVSASPYEEIKQQNEQLQNLTVRLKASELQYRTLTDSLPLVIFSLDAQGKIVFANRWLDNYAGQSLQTLKDAGWATIIHADDLAVFNEMLNRIKGSHTNTIKRECRLLHAQTGTYFWHLVVICRFEEDTPDGASFIGYMVDIHTQKEFEELKLVKDKLQRNELELHNIIHHLNISNKELEQFAYIASHDLQEPVRKMIFYSDYFKQHYAHAIDEAGLVFLDKMLAASLRMRSLIMDLLSFSDVRKESVSFAKVDLNKVALDVLQDMELIINEKEAIVSIDQLPVVEGNYQQLVQLFGNIISNSIKYAKPGVAPLIRISGADGNGDAVISFIDNGIGFDQTYLTKIFSLFQRLHTKEEYSGTGLGLAICKKIAELHNGSITAASTPGHGAIFKLTLPLIQLNKIS
ncbi:sensor histidine kinase [Deminuibacter soli]|uniref:histidine kinase n=1 Tax=Deminuibacter soli TaxID=2291815 RepID=A0A3E1NGC4_9BACT|nr:ATP-binding protein [Deminuibacter soli]RFM26874.1 PAS domain S-box protein [Deminuibacter soli]